MGAGLVQLLFYGQQDIYLKSNPSITFFKKVYRTHTNFSMEGIEVNLNRTEANIYEKTLFRAKIQRHADLVAHIYLVIELPDIISDNNLSFRWIENMGEAMIDNCYISIGGNIIDKQSGEYMHAYNYLSHGRDRRELYNKMTGNVNEISNPEQYQLDYANLSRIPLRYRVGGSYPIGKDTGNISDFTPSIASRKIYIPLQFWFNKDVGTALPLVSLQYAEVEVVIEIRPIVELYKIYYAKNGKYDFYAPDISNTQHKISNFVSNTRSKYSISDSILDMKAYLDINYIYLDNLERKYFAYKPLEYLIEQVTRIEQIDLEENNIINLVLQNPVKEIIWYLRRNDIDINNNWFLFTETNGTNIMKTAKIMFNGVDRINDKDAEYYNWVQPYQHHTGIGKPGLYCYSFALYPDEYQPSGSVNMSRINKIQIALNVNIPTDQSYKYDVVFYVLNYNILKVMSGMASVVYSL